MLLVSQSSIHLPKQALVWKVYCTTCWEGGLLGYGTDSVSSFPPKIPGLPMAVHARETLLES